MTQEEKAKSYDEALEKAKEHINSKGIGDTVDLCKHLFPQLQESEDERMMKNIRLAILSVDDAFWRTHGLTAKEAISYLEKQKEQEPICDSAQFEEGFKTGLEIGLRKQKEQKPAEWSEKHIADVFEKVGLAKIVREQANDALTNAVQSAMIELSKAGNTEWSEEDEDYMNAIIAIINRETALYPKGGATEDLNNDLIAWLKSLRPSWKPSEDEERLINTSISFLKDFADKGYENAVECIDWLKSKLNGNSDK